ncbi:MAG: HAMP domain-containing sensor histidine kinase [Vicinamibacterales bacterium]
MDTLLALTDEPPSRPSSHAASAPDTLVREVCGALHDVNNLLGIITLSAELALDDEAGRIQHLRVIRDIATRAGVVSHRAIELVRGRGTACPESADVHQMLTSLLPLLQSVCGDIGLHVEPLASNPRVGVDASSLDRVLTNLVTNARDASRAGGIIRIVTHDATLQTNGQRRVAAVSIEVHDQGTGIADDLRTMIFEPFFSTKGGSGSGLGLANVRAIVEAAGGLVTVESRPGTGACFRVVLPRVERSHH